MKAISRRMFLRGAGGLTVGLPLLTSLLPRKAEAQAAAQPIKRFITYFNPNGVIPATWYPTAGADERSFTIAAAHQPLAPFRDKLIWTSGIDMKSSKAGPGERHQTGMGTLLTGRPLLAGNFVGGDGSLAGWGSGISVDQRMVQSIGRSTTIPSLQLGVRASGAEVRHRLSYLDTAMPLPPENDPRAAFDRLFGETGTAPEEVQRLRRQRKSVLDAVLDQFGALDRKLGTDDKRKVDAHLSLVRDLEQRIVVNGPTCTPPAEPAQLPVDSETTMPTIMRLQMDILAVALSCDLTRVASVQCSNAENHIAMPWIDSRGDGHSLSHAGPSSPAEAAELTKRDTWYAGELAYLLGRLDSVMESGRSVLDNSIVFWGNELSVGATHSHIDMPFLIAGGAGYFRMGRYLRYDHASHVNMLLSFLHAMDIDDQTFGDPEFCEGPLSGLR